MHIKDLKEIEEIVRLSSSLEEDSCWHKELVKLLQQKLSDIELERDDTNQMVLQ